MFPLQLVPPVPVQGWEESRNGQLLLKKSMPETRNVMMIFYYSYLQHFKLKQRHWSQSCHIAWKLKKLSHCPLLLYRFAFDRRASQLWSYHLYSLKQNYQSIQLASSTPKSFCASKLMSLFDLHTPDIICD